MLFKDDDSREIYYLGISIRNVMDGEIDIRKELAEWLKEQNK